MKDDDGEDTDDCRDALGLSMKRFVCLILMTIVSLSAAWAAAEEKTLSGTYQLGGKTLVDPPADEPPDTHFRMTLTGAAAQDLYRSMKVRAKSNACGDAGSLLKTIGQMQCERSADGKRYQCSFAIDIAGQRITGGTVC